MNKTLLKELLKHYDSIFYYLATLSDSEHRDFESISNVDSYLDSLVYHSMCFRRLLKDLNQDFGIYNFNIKNLRKLLNEN